MDQTRHTKSAISSFYIPVYELRATGHPLGRKLSRMIYADIRVGIILVTAKADVH